ncbi:cation:proton antiporter [Marinactinospora thermotolerans]|uniref:Potassium/proton antiporter membrane subunit, CPA2 family (TC 2.A.37.5.2) n=1 Tax=Marinactinospora thermotolerans DSM 45154 TaxID=1122192 RepID=A0A1T4T4D9_9ACTN|nr:cation:proton antiporter [Marinactinospora thermotolerans]SKA35342.1 potassium/proton antiporter membrane subunit, CPA2 family (TC 2.A.37.5.2) [Marinactinospora thermotolerans DSM 45154]
MPESAALLIEFGAVLVAVSGLAALARRWAFPAVPLYLLAGLALGEGGVLPVPAVGEFAGLVASIGVVLLLLLLGLEFSAAEFTDSLRRHLPSAFADALLNAVPGALAGAVLGLGWQGCLALAGITWVSSSGIVARVLGDLRRLANRETPAVLSVLVLEDISMAVYLPLLGAAVAGASWGGASLALGTALSAVALALFASHRLRWLLGRLLDTGGSEQFLLRVLGLTLLVAGVCELAHASAAVGAFLVGLALSGNVADRTRRLVEPLRDLFAFVFFLAIGLSIDPRDLLPVLPAALALAAATALTKVATGWYAARRDGVGARGRWRAGTALIVRGEFSVVVAGLAASVEPLLVPLSAAYVIILGVVGPAASYLAGRPSLHRG